MTRRIESHPVLGDLSEASTVTIYVDGEPLEARDGEPIAAALLASGKHVFRTTPRLGEPRSVFCAIGRCTDCAMTVDGRPNVRTCVTPVSEGMRVETQMGLGRFSGIGSRGIGFQPMGGGTEPRAEHSSATSHALEAHATLQQTEVAVVGSGPAGLCAAIEAARAGAKVILLDENDRPGGQLLKQIHRFFGTADHYASERGFEIGRELLAEVEELGVDVRLKTVVWGAFAGPVLGCATGDGHSYRLSAERIVFATGASELAAAFPGWTLPGVMGAGAAQTLMNLHRVRPGQRALAVGSGNVGLIVSYQLMQAGIEVAAVVEALRHVGGWHVHAARVRRAGVPILTGHTVLEAHGEDHVTAATIARVDGSGQPVPGTERRVEVDVICLAVGLRPQTQLAEMLDLETTHDRRRGGLVPVRDATMRSSNASVYVAGDLGAISEASIAMEEGRIAGRAAAASLGHGAPGRTEQIISEAQERIRILDVDIPPLDEPGPMQRRLACSQERPAGPVPVIECYQRIPCDPCESSCPTGAIRVGRDPTALPAVDADKCTGCLRCVRLCPGMAIFVVEALPEQNEALISIPREFLLLPERGQVGQGLGREGHAVCSARVVRIGRFGGPGDTAVLTLAVPLQHIDDVRGFTADTWRVPTPVEKEPSQEMRNLGTEQEREVG